MVKSAGNPIFLGNGAPKKFWPLLETLARTFFHNSLNEVNDHIIDGVGGLETVKNG